MQETLTNTEVMWLSQLSKPENSLDPTHFLSNWKISNFALSVVHQLETAFIDTLLLLDETLPERF